MKHPYKIYKIVPEMESEVLNVEEPALVAAHQRHLNSISERNKSLIPADIYQSFKASSA